MIENIQLEKFVCLDVTVVGYALNNIVTLTIRAIQILELHSTILHYPIPDTTTLFYQLPITMKKLLFER